MLITGSRFRHLYSQDTLNWLIQFEPLLGNSGVFNFSFETDNGKVPIFSLKNGKILSPSEEMVDGFSSNTILLLSGNLTNNRADLYNSTTPLYLGNKTIDFNQITGFSFESINGGAINFTNLNILGDTPEYFYDPNLYYRSGESIKFNIFNSGSSHIEIFSGILSNNIRNYFTLNGLNNLKIPPNNSGSFSLVNNGNIAFNNGSIFIDTNFGSRELLISLSGIRLEDELYYLSLGPETFIINDGEYQDYNIVFRNIKTSNISIELKYISGVTGDYFQPVQHFNFVDKQFVSGEIFGSGYLYGDASGLLSGYNILNDTYEYGTGYGIAQGFKIAEDQYIEKNFLISGSGLGDVYLKTSITGTGFSDRIIYSGWTTYRGGILTGQQSSGWISGLIPDRKSNWLPNKFGNLVPNIDPTIQDIVCLFSDCTTGYDRHKYASGLIDINQNFGQGFSYLNYKYTGVVTGNYSNDEVYDELFTYFPVYITGDFKYQIETTGIALATGNPVSGKLLGDPAAYFEPGYWIIYKPWSGLLEGSIYDDKESFYGFDPDSVAFERIDSSGYWGGIIYASGGIDLCEISFPEYAVKEIPNYVILETPTGLRRFDWDISGGPVIQPNTGLRYLEWPFEFSDFAIKSGDTQLYEWYPPGNRTRISRMGNTPSGSGLYDNLFQLPRYNGVNEQKFITGSDGFPILDEDNQPFLSWKYVLDASGEKIPLFTNEYECAPLMTGSDGKIITGLCESGGLVAMGTINMPLFCTDSNDCINGVCKDGICYDPKPAYGSSSDDKVYALDDNGNLIAGNTQQCSPLCNSSGEFIYKPLLDIFNTVYIFSGRNIVRVKTQLYDPEYTGDPKELVQKYLMEPDMFQVSLDFFGWKEEIPVTKGRKFLEGPGPAITGISGNCLLGNDCDTSYINFIITGSGTETVDFSFKALEPKKFVKFDLFQSGFNDALFSISGGLWFYTGNNTINQSVNLDSGHYFGEINFIPYECLKDSISLYSCLSFSDSSFTGCEQDGFLSAKILRNGYSDHTLKTRITAYFTGPQYKYLSSGVKVSGITWDLSWNQKEFEKIVSFPIYPNNKKENDTYGEFHINITDVGELPAEFVGINTQIVDFVIKDFEFTGEATIANKGQYPTYPSGYEIDYTRFGLDLDPTIPEPPSLQSWPYTCFSGFDNSCAGVICPPNYVIDTASCLCAPPLDSDPSEPILPVEVACEGVPIIVNGYAFYRDVRENVLVPGLGNIPIGCAGGHACNRTNFLPVISFEGGLRYESASEISLNNVPGGGGRDAMFNITIPNSLDITGKKSQFVLECKSPNNDCHEGVTFVVMTTTVGGSTIKLFQECVAPDQVTNFPILCSGYGCENNLYQDFEYFTGGATAGNTYGNITIDNPTNKDISFIMEGTVDDDLMINGSPYDPTCCIFAGGLNGAHTFSLISGLVRNESFTLGARDNHGRNASYSFRICWISGAV